MFKGWFQFVYTAIFVAFMLVMVVVVITAYGRRSGRTGLDMAKVQQIRHHAHDNHVAEREP